MRLSFVTATVVWALLIAGCGKERSPEREGRRADPSSGKRRTEKPEESPPQSKMQSRDQNGLPTVPPLKWELVQVAKVQGVLVAVIRDHSTRKGNASREYTVREGDEVPGHFGVTITKILEDPPSVLYHRPGIGEQRLSGGEPYAGASQPPELTWDTVISAVREGHTYVVKLAELRRSIPSIEEYALTFIAEPNIDPNRICEFDVVLEQTRSGIASPTVAKLRYLLEREMEALTPVRELSANIQLSTMLSDLTGKIAPNFDWDLMLVNWTRSRTADLPALPGEQDTRALVAPVSGRITLRGDIAREVDLALLRKALEDLPQVASVEQRNPVPAAEAKSYVEFTLALDGSHPKAESSDQEPAVRGDGRGADEIAKIQKQWGLLKRETGPVMQKLMERGKDFDLSAFLAGAEKRVRIERSREIASRPTRHGALETRSSTYIYASAGLPEILALLREIEQPERVIGIETLRISPKSLGDRSHFELYAKLFTPIVVGSEDGLKITKLPADNFLYAAGLRQGDVLKTINDSRITDKGSAIELLRSAAEGFNVQVGILRGETTRTLFYTMLKE